MSRPLEPRKRAILNEITSRFLKGARGTPSHEIRVSLGPERHLLDSLCEEGYLQIKGDKYLPKFGAIEEQDPDLRSLGRTRVSVVLQSLQNVYKRSGTAVWRADRLMEEARQIESGVSDVEIQTGLILANDFGYFSRCDFDREGKLEWVHLRETILDFQSVADSWNRTSRQTLTATLRDVSNGRIIYSRLRAFPSRELHGVRSIHKPPERSPSSQPRRKKQLRNGSFRRPTRSPKQGSETKFDLGIIVPLKEEFKVLEELCPVTRSQTHDAIHYHTLKIPGSNYRIVAVVIGDMGPTPASQVTEKMLSHIDLKAVVLLGIAGALDKNLKLGDVVVANEINEFHAASKAVPRGKSFVFKYSGNHWASAFAVTNFLSNFEFTAKGLYQAWRKKVSTYRDSLRMNSQKRSLTHQKPEFTIGHIASGNSVGASKAYAIELLGIDRKFLALEMEAAGVMMATHRRETPIKTIVLRGISDFSDERKRALDSTGDGVWRKYAMYSATVLLLNMLRAQEFQRIV